VFVVISHFLPDTGIRFHNGMYKFTALRSMNILYLFIVIVVEALQNWLCFKFFQNILNFGGQNAARYVKFYVDIINVLTYFQYKHL
jgi:hypothetical protein